MKIKSSIAIYTGIIASIPILTTLVFLWSFQNLERELSDLGDDGIVLQEYATFKGSITHWFILADLVVAGGETYLISDTLNHGEKLLEYLADIESSLLARNALEECVLLRKLIRDSSKLISGVAPLNSEMTSEDNINKHLLFDDSSQQIVAMIPVLGVKLEAQRNTNINAFTERRSKLFLYLIASIALNIAFVLVCWRYLSVYLVKPLELLTDSARNGVANGEILSISTDGPIEIKELTESFRQAASSLERMALYDALTGLSNRALFSSQLEKQLALLNRRDSNLAVLFFDFDKFKSVNDTYGHDAGDELLVQFARRTETCIRKGDTLARLGGDEFILILADITDEEIVEIVVQKIYAVLAAPIELCDVSWYLKVSVGISITQDHTTLPAAIVKEADQALYWAKNNRPGSSCYYSEMISRHKRVLHIEDDATSRMIMKRFIQKETDYELLQADSADDGMALALREKPDLVILDLTLGDKNGEDIARALRDIKGFDNRPLIAVTASNKDESKLLSIGFSAVFRKPLNYPIFLQDLNNQLHVRS